MLEPLPHSLHHPPHHQNLRTLKRRAAGLVRSDAKQRRWGRASCHHQMRACPKEITVCKRLKCNNLCDRLISKEKKQRKKAYTASLVHWYGPAAPGRYADPGVPAVPAGERSVTSSAHSHTSLNQSRPPPPPRAPSSHSLACTRTCMHTRARMHTHARTHTRACTRTRQE